MVCLFECVRWFDCLLIVCLFICWFHCLLCLFVWCLFASFFSLLCLFRSLFFSLSLQHSPSVSFALCVSVTLPAVCPQHQHTISTHYITQHEKHSNLACLQSPLVTHLFAVCVVSTTQPRRYYMRQSPLSYIPTIHDTRNTIHNHMIHTHMYIRTTIVQCQRSSSQ